MNTLSIHAFFVYTLLLVGGIASLLLIPHKQDVVHADTANTILIIVTSTPPDDDDDDGGSSSNNPDDPDPEIDEMSVTIRGLRPQGRLIDEPTDPFTSGTNVPTANYQSSRDDYRTRFYITVRSGGSILFTQSAIVTSDEQGNYDIPIEVTGLTAGTYDIGLKGEAHLTRVFDNVRLTPGETEINFDLDDSAGLLLAGDISGGGLTPASLGDDQVNSVDLSVILASLNIIDTNPYPVRPNLNHDSVVNSIDLSILLDNLNRRGET